MSSTSQIASLVSQQLTANSNEDLPMEFNIKMVSTPDLGAIAHAIRAVDPSAQVDLDPQGRTLRVAASINANELATLISQAGTPVAQHQVTQAPSVCCGGCSG